MVFRHPIARVAEAVGELGEIDRIAQRLCAGRACRYWGEVEDRKRDHGAILTRLLSRDDLRNMQAGTGTREPNRWPRCSNGRYRPRRSRARRTTATTSNARLTPWSAFTR